MYTSSDNRINPRVPFGIQVKVIFPDRREIQIHSENISLSGIMVVAAKPEFEALLNRKNTQDFYLQPEVQVSFNIASKSASNLTVNVTCRAIHIRRISQNRYLIGLKFLQLNQMAASAIQYHIESNLS